MSAFLEQMKARAKSERKTIVLPEGEDERTLKAAKIILDEGIASLIILGSPDEIHVEGAQVIDPKTSEKREAYAQKFYELRKSKGISLEDAQKQMLDAT